MSSSSSTEQAVDQPSTPSSTVTNTNTPNNPKTLKKQITYSCGMKLDNIIRNDENGLLNDNCNKLHRCKEIENLTEQQEHENEILNQDSDALHSKTHLKRTFEIENLNEFKMPRRAESVQTFSNYRDYDSYGYNDSYNNYQYGYGQLRDNNPNRLSLSALSTTSPNSSPRLSTSRSNKYSNNGANKPELTSRIQTTQLIVEQVQKSKIFENRRNLTEHSQPLNSFSSARKSGGTNNEVKGMTIGKMMMMSNGERTKLVENRIQDRLLDKKLQDIQKQAAKNEMKIKRARSLLLDEYMQTKAVNANVNPQNRPKTVTNQMIQQSTYLPNYLKSKKMPSVVSSQDYEEHLEKLKKVAEKNRYVCTRHKRHRLSGEFQRTNAEFEEVEKFNLSMNPQAQPHTQVQAQSQSGETTVAVTEPINDSGKTQNTTHHVKFSIDIEDSTNPT